jgi:AcrR family transcriptional regulator
MKDKKQYKLLVNKSRELFMKYGLKNLTMDDIAKELGMSKKTIYQFVENKAGLIKLTLEDYLDEEKECMAGILKNAKNSIDEIVQLIGYLSQALREFNASSMYDMQKYYPESWDMYTDYRYNFLLARIKTNLENGIKEGYYRKELNTDIISKIYVFSIEIIRNQELFPAGSYAFINSYLEFQNYHLRGIVSPKGLKYLEEQNLFRP